MAKILIVDNDPATRLHVRNLVQADGHELLEASSGVEGIRQATVHVPDLILVEVNLPDLDGYEVSLRLRGIGSLSSKPVIVMSSGRDVQTTLAVGATGTLTKPIDGTRFVKILDEFLRGYHEEADGLGENRLREKSLRIVERLEQKVVELSEANKKMEEMMRLRREFLQNVSHELATPMTPVIGYLRLLLNGEMGGVSPMQEKCLRSIETSVQRLRGIIDALLDVSSLETERMHFYHRDYDFLECVRGVLEKTKTSVDESGLRLSVSLPEGTLLTRGDPDKVQRALTHLLDNALKFTPRGGKIAVEVRDQQLNGAQVCSFVVADSGPGIAREELARVVEPFYQVDGSVTRQHGGVGLGLAFAHRVAKGLGGGTRIASPPGQAVAGKTLEGTLVEFWVPKHLAAGRA